MLLEILSFFTGKKIVILTDENGNNYRSLALNNLLDESLIGCYIGDWWLPLHDDNTCGLNPFGFEKWRYKDEFDPGMMVVQ